jgi:DNA topoisomerase-1
LVKKWGRNGWFLACPGYPECKFTKSLNGEAKEETTEEVCDKCGSPMVIKNGRSGRFLACSAYPNCKNAKPISLGIHCPKDGCKGKWSNTIPTREGLLRMHRNIPIVDYCFVVQPPERKMPALRHNPCCSSHQA